MIAANANPRINVVATPMDYFKICTNFEIVESVQDPPRTGTLGELTCRPYGSECAGPPLVGAQAELVAAGSS